MSLKEYILERGALSEHDAGAITERILHVLKYLRDIKVAHRDLNPVNILIYEVEGKNNLVKVTGFEMATHFQIGKSM